MKKLVAIVIFLSLFAPLIARAAIIDQRCFSDNFGDLYLFSGGKLDKKAYMVRALTVACHGEIAGVANFGRLSDGTWFLSGMVGGNYTTCVPFQVAAVFDSTLTSGNGNFDTFPRNSVPDGLLTFTPISCASVPLNNPEFTPYVPPGPLPGKPKE